MKIGPTADPTKGKLQERNAFYRSLPPRAKERFLDALERAEADGQSGDAAWERAVVAAETAYADERKD